MPFLNYTNRINIICNDEHNSDIRVYASSQNNHYYVFQENLERVKKEGGIEYKGARSFIIAKDRSLKQEGWWEEILKSKYGEESVVSIFGEVDVKDRKKAVESFQNDSNVRFFVGNPTTGGFGLTLTACNTVVYFSNNYNLEVTVTGEIDQESGYLIDMKVLSDTIKKEVLDKFDHKNLNLDVEDFKHLNPTAENMAIVIHNKLTAKLDKKFELKIKLYETERNSVIYPC